MDHMLGLSKFKKIEITSNFFFDHIAIGYKSTTHTHTHTHTHAHTCTHTKLQTIQI